MRRALGFSIAVGWTLLLFSWVVRTCARVELGPLSHLYFVPAPFFLPAAGCLAVAHVRLWGHHRWQVLAALLFTAGPVMGFCWGSQSVPPPIKLRVVTANVQSYTADLTKVGETLAALDPDIIILQEVWTIRYLNELKQSLPEHKFVQAGGFIADDYLATGVFVGTRLPIEADQNFDHALCVDVGSAMGPVRIIGLHGRKTFGYWPSDILETMRLQRAQISSIWRASDRTPCIVAGDFNAPPSAPAVKCLRGKLDDSFVEAGRGYGLTFPAAAPVWRLDQMFHTRGLRAVRCWTVWTGADHLAVVAEFITSASDE